MTEPKDAIADNNAVDKAKFTFSEAQAGVELPPWLHRHWVSEQWTDDHDGTGVGCLRVNVGPAESAIGLSLSMEDKDSGFDVGAYVSMDEDQALQVADAIIKTVEAQR